MVSVRKPRLSGKRKIIDGHISITTVEKLNGVKEAEENTPKKRGKRGGSRRRGRSKAQRESSDESEIDSDDSNEGVV